MTGGVRLGGVIASHRNEPERHAVADFYLFLRNGSGAYPHLPPVNGGGWLEDSSAPSIPGCFLRLAVGTRFLAAGSVHLVPAHSRRMAAVGHAVLFADRRRRTKAHGGGCLAVAFVVASASPFSLR